MARKYNEGVAESNRKRVKHGGTVDARLGKVDKRYKLWGSMQQRCTNPNSYVYPRYGGRGITMCKRWMDSYADFIADIGEQHEGMTLERIDNDKGYEPNNVRWATRKEQANNRATNIVITWGGLTMTLKQWAEHLGWKYGLLTGRWSRGKRDKELFAPPKWERGKLVEFEGEFRALSEWVKVLGINYQTLKWRLNNGKDLRGEQHD